MKRINYILLFIAVLIIIIGFALMSGGGSSNPQIFNDEIFSTQRIVIAPIIVTIGFLFFIVGLMYKSKK